MPAHIFNYLSYMSLSHLPQCRASGKQTLSWRFGSLQYCVGVKALGSGYATTAKVSPTESWDGTSNLSQIGAIGLKLCTPQVPQLLAVEYVLRAEHNLEYFTGWNSFVSITANFASREEMSS
jgi:hypothetical protein